MVYKDIDPINKDSKITVLVVDDEQLARNLICSLVRKDSDLSVIGTCGDGAQARQAINRLRPDIVFLDIQMPKLNGVDLVRTFAGDDAAPYVVFVTAFDQYALEAFEMDALDYLLKPIDPDRFRITTARAKAAIQQKRIGILGRRIAEMSTQAEVPPPAAKAKHLVVKKGDELVHLPLADIVWIEAASQYVHIHSTQHVYTLAKSLKVFQKSLPAGMFTRVHRSAVVNNQHVNRILKKPNGVHALVLDDGTTVSLSRSRKKLVHELLAETASLPD